MIYDFPFNGYLVSKFLFKCLERAVSNEEWFDNFADSTVLLLSKVTFDHKHVLVHFNRKERNKSGKRPFCFLATWLTNNRFIDLIADTWNSGAF